MPATEERFDALRAGGATLVDVVLVDVSVVNDDEILELIESEIRTVSLARGLNVRSIVRRA